MSPPSLTSLLAASLLATALTACANPPMDDEFSTFPGDRPNEIQRGAKPPVPRHNPAAVPYEITLEIENAPGPFGHVVAEMDYDVADRRCMPRLGGMSGTRVQGTQVIPVRLERIGPSTYRGVVYDELLVDEDYYGLGICRWRFEGVGFGLQATGSDADTRFGEYLSRNDITAGERVRGYAAHLHYPATDIPGYTAVTYRDPAKFRPEHRDRLLVLDFSIRKLKR